MKRNQKQSQPLPSCCYQPKQHLSNSKTTSELKKNKRTFFQFLDFLSLLGLKEKKPNWFQSTESFLSKGVPQGCIEVQVSGNLEGPNVLKFGYF